MKEMEKGFFNISDASAASVQRVWRPWLRAFGHARLTLVNAPVEAFVPVVKEQQRAQNAQLRALFDAGAMPKGWALADWADLVRRRQPIGQAGYGASAGGKNLHYSCGFRDKSVYERTRARSMFRHIVTRENGDCGEDGATLLWDQVLLRGDRV